jgi:hypothetical protein
MLDWKLPPAEAGLNLVEDTRMKILIAPMAIPAGESHGPASRAR